MDRYRQRGVSSSKREVHSAITELDKGLYPGAFCSIFPFEDLFHSVKHADGAGTKAGLAYLAHKHGFPIRVWRGVTVDSIVMNIDDVACVGATDENIYVTQNINRNPFRISGEVLSELINGDIDFCKKMHTLGFNILIVGGETADVPDLVRTITVDNDVFTRVANKQIVDASRIKMGDVIIGFSSTGQAAWEDSPNSGIGSNGLTNARHDCLCARYRVDTETYSPEMPPELVYRGKYYLDDQLPEDKRFTIGSALLSPTRTYLPLIAKILKRCGDMRPLVHAFIHCSGGGQTKIGKFGPTGVMYHKYNLFPMPPLFVTLQNASGLPWRQMYSSYNAGHRLEAVVTEELVDLCISVAEACNIEARVIGRVVRKRGKTRVKIESPYGVFNY